MAGKGDDGTDDELSLFRQELAALQGVKPLHANRVETPRRRHAPVPAQRLADDRRVVQALREADPRQPDVETGEESWFLRPGMQQRVLRRLRRGHYSLGAELDLHGHDSVAAHAALATFLAECRGRGVRGVRIIHGRGRGSADGRAVLRQRLDGWLRHRDDVVAFCSARPADGGSGATYVLLRG